MIFGCDLMYLCLIHLNTIINSAHDDMPVNVDLLNSCSKGSITVRVCVHACLYECYVCVLVLFVFVCFCYACV